MGQTKFLSVYQNKTSQKQQSLEDKILLQ